MAGKDRRRFKIIRNKNSYSIEEGKMPTPKEMEIERARLLKEIRETQKRMEALLEEIGKALKVKKPRRKNV